MTIDRMHLEFLGSIARGDIESARGLAGAMRADGGLPSGFPRRPGFLAHLDREIRLAVRDRLLVERGQCHVLALAGRPGGC
jgi:hypothetical protein